MSTRNWHYYLIENSLSQLYTGITTDVERRFAEHQANGAKTARSLRGKGPLILRHHSHAGDHSNALKLERRIKRLSRAHKLALIAGSISIEQLWPELTP
ncbi:GIY-YIG nuclease family protein [Ferrimonas lipolytica]|uniref:GIY-YIG nuclease family protein n=1 Tax=Ferrimonas lipolytica TaxID=2724191 RepID=A0A6H1UCH2_9GAMM|nr:GIY-YIG nuclease family protein [Ferrimonas lipolytica]QIZ76339.1 GIY-YIG nuclease family protein [Ferrimonas lipolytica]